VLTSVAGPAGAGAGTGRTIINVTMSFNIANLTGGRWRRQPALGI